MAKRVFYPIGSISSGTLLDVDLIERFAAELDSLASRKDTAVRAKDRAAHRKMARQAESFDVVAQGPDETAGLICALQEALQEYAAPYFYFGAHPGDGADFGYWVPETLDWEFDGLQVSDTADVPRNYRGEVLHVNDHGNATLYVANGRGVLREIWSIV